MFSFGIADRTPVGLHAELAAPSQAGQVTRVDISVLNASGFAVAAPGLKLAAVMYKEGFPPLRVRN